LFLAAVWAGNACYAASGRYGYAELQEGMSYSDVIKLWGPAVLKIQYETKRRDAWQYGVAKVIFQEGKVVDWQAGEKVQGEKNLPAENLSILTESVEEQSQARALLDEILREVPSEAEAPAKSGTAAESAASSRSEIEPRGELAQPVMRLKDREFPE